ncbi:hypothetical protein [Glaciihabitans arcticus]|uniref:hypothetical protein n=1 Tax=Glaciihabitans arcticus TaxID=2668039 RepID=UPI0012AB59F1|nr:hypothetical protein [Glaciihabitans arcticus]
MAIRRMVRVVVVVVGLAIVGWTESVVVYGGLGLIAAALIVLATTRRRVVS